MPLEPLPKPEFRLRPRHLWHILDLIVIAALFMATGRVYLNTRGEKVMQAKEADRAAAQVEGVRLIQQADSVVAATTVTLQGMLADSTEAFGELSRMRVELETGIERRQALSQQIFPLSENVLALKERTQDAVASVERYEKDLAAREAEIDSLGRMAQTSQERLDRTRVERQEAARNLLHARQEQAYEPTGNFPERTGLMVKREAGKDVDLTSLELQQILWRPNQLDVGLALGVGLGDGESVSDKEVGLLVTRQLIHRRLGLDLGAGYSVLTQPEGRDETGAYASAGLRLSPFYQERLHLGLGARAKHGEVLPFLGVTVGRR